MEKRAFFGRIADKLAAFVEKVVGVFRTALGLNPPKEEWHAQSNFSNAHNWKTASDIAPVVGKTCSAPALAHKRAQLEEEVVLKKRRADAVRSAIASAGDGREIDEKQLYEKADGDAAEALCNYHEAAARQAAFKIASSAQPANAEEELETQTSGEILKKSLEKIEWLEGRTQVVETQKQILSELNLFDSHAGACLPNIRKTEDFFYIK